MGNFQEQTQGVAAGRGICVRKLAEAVRGRLHSHINSLLITRPEAVYNLLWGGDLVAFVQQGVQFGVFDDIKFLFPTIAELSILRALADVMPEGIYGAGRYYFNWPDTEDTRRFVNAYLEAYGEYPSPSTAQSY